MKHLLKKLKYRRPDEMEKAILHQAQKNAYLFLIAALLFWSLYESYQVYHTHSRLNLLPCLLLVTAAFIQTLSQAILTRNAVKGDIDAFETEPFIKMIIVICIAVSIIATTATAFIFTGVIL